jgi:hypothetical protein
MKRIPSRGKESSMSDNKNDVGAPDRDLIAMGEEHEVRYWTQALGVSKEKLQEAVNAVGSGAEKVREYLRD